MREFFDRLDAGQYDVWVLVALVLLFIVATLWPRSSNAVHTVSRVPLTKMEAQLSFQVAQRRAQEAFEDPTVGPGSNGHFMRVMHALDMWEQWQGRPLSTLQDVGCDPTEAEWHALSLLNSIPQRESQHVM